MENETLEIQDTQTSCGEDSKNRLSAACKFASEQYDKVRRATMSQIGNVRDYTAGAREQIQQKWAVTRDKACEVHKASEEFVKENPTGTVLGALGLGVIIGLLLGSRR